MCVLGLCDVADACDKANERVSNMEFSVRKYGDGDFIIEILIDGYPVASNMLTPMPDGFVYSSGLYVGDSYRGRGFANMLQKVKEYAARLAHCNYLIASVNNDNIIQHHILEKNGWVRQGSGYNHINSLWVKTIDYGKDFEWWPF